jgi:dTDP-4-amino-4,6-dideoxygalactose transaminase
VGCFSFYPGKNLGAFGEAGAIATSDAKIAARIRRLRDHAQDGRHNHVEIGYNARMEGLQGAVLAVKLNYLDEWTEDRRRHAALFNELLGEVRGLQLPEARSPEAHVWHLYVVLLEGVARQELMQQLSERGIATAIHYPTPVPYQPAYAHLGYRRGDFPVAEDVASRCLSLPMFPSLTEEQIFYVADSIKEILGCK